MQPPQIRPILPTTLRGRRGQQANLNHGPLPNHWQEVQRIDETPWYRLLTGATPVYSPDNPHRWGTSTRLQDSIDHILARLPSQQVLNVSVVIALPPRGTYVEYYLVDEDAHEIFWFNDGMGSLFRSRLLMSHTEYCCESFLKAEYWIHIENFPPSIPFEWAEDDLIWRLLASMVSGNSLLSPWTPEGCQQHIETIESNRDHDVSVHVRMETLGALLTAFQSDQHEACHGLLMGRRERRRNVDPVAEVRRNAGHPHHRYTWSETALVLMDLDRPLGPIALYYVLLALANKAVQPKNDPLSDIALCVSIAISTAILLISILSLPLYIWVTSCIFEIRNNGPFRNWLWSGFLAFKAFVYGCLLSTFGRLLSVDPPEHQFSFAGLVMLTFVLALPPAFHILRLSNFQ